MRRFNERVAVAITNGVGTMWCAYAFTALALFGLPGAIQQGIVGIVQWVAQTFLQLVLLSVILVGQNLQAEKHDDIRSSVDGLHAKHDALHEHLGVPPTN